MDKVICMDCEREIDGHDIDQYRQATGRDDNPERCGCCEGARRDADRIASELGHSVERITDAVSCAVAAMQSEGADLERMHEIVVIELRCSDEMATKLCRLALLALGIVTNNPATPAYARHLAENL